MQPVPQWRRTRLVAVGASRCNSTVVSTPDVGTPLPRPPKALAARLCHIPPAVTLARTRGQQALPAMQEHVCSGAAHHRVAQERLHAGVALPLATRAVMALAWRAATPGGGRPHLS